MKKIPCRKCSCGTYHDFTVTTCRCGKDISEVEVGLVDVDGLSEEEYGEIDRNLIIYAQRCRRCGAFTFTTDPEKPLTNCSGCKSRTIAGVKPVLYVDKDEKAKNEENPVNEESPERTATAEKTSAPEEDEEEEIVDWGGIVGGLEEVLHKTTGEFEAKTEPAPSSAPSVKNLTLTAVCFGNLTFTVTAAHDSPYMLGRSAGQGNFLAQDGRVSNEHCLLIYRDGSWFVRDNHSSNGTAVNSRDIGLNGECVLNSGDELKLGHHPDSMAFRVTLA